MITSTGASALLRHFITFSRLESVCLKGNTLHNQTLVALFDLFQGSKSVMKVSIGNGIDDDGILMIRNYAQKVDRYVSIDLSDNRAITRTSLSCIIDIIDNTKVEISSTAHTFIGSCTSIVPSLMKSRILSSRKDATFYKMGVTDDNIMKICEHFKTFGYGIIETIE